MQVWHVLEFDVTYEASVVVSQNQQYFKTLAIVLVSLALTTSRSHLKSTFSPLGTNGRLHPPTLKPRDVHS
jgi:hypothetical protein